MKHTFGFLLGAGSSKPFGIPTTEDMANDYLKITKNEYLKKLFNSKTPTDIETIIKGVHQIKELPNNLGIKLLSDGGKNFSKLDAMVSSLKETEKELSEYIRKKCLSPDIDKAIGIYEDLLKLQDLATLKIFTTNYDVIIEEVCHKLKSDLTDGFVSAKHEYHKILDILSLNKGDIQLYKLHGSVNWWSDSNRQKIFNLAPDIMGTGKYNNLMIYPAEKEDVFNFPFNLLQWIFGITLNDIDELFAIGHKFGDPNITSTVKAALENPDFKLTIVGPSASKIKKTIFPNNDKVITVDKKFEDWAPEGIKLLTETAKAANQKIKEREEKEKEEKRKIIELTTLRDKLQERINEFERKESSINLRNFPLTNDPGTLSLGNTYLTDSSIIDTSVSPTNLTIGPTGSTIDFGGLIGAQPDKAIKTCTNCWKSHYPENIIDGKCPSCGFLLDSSPDSK